MTDNEIIKALECCMLNPAKYICSDCPLYERNLNVHTCSAHMAREIYHLINRQRAEIERLEEENKRLIKEVGSRNKRIGESLLEYSQLEDNRNGG